MNVSYIPQQQLGALFDKEWRQGVIKKIKTGADIVKKGVSEQYLKLPEPPPSESKKGFMDKYGTFVIIGGVGLAGLLAYNAMRR